MTRTPGPYTRSELEQLKLQVVTPFGIERLKATIAQGYAPDARPLTWRDVLDCKPPLRTTHDAATDARQTAYRYFVHNERLFATRLSDDMKHAYYETGYSAEDVTRGAVMVDEYLNLLDQPKPQ